MSKNLIKKTVLIETIMGTLTTPLLGTILKSNYTHMGLGFNSNGNYWTQMFVSY